jgi:dimethylhistidine N-methyltransferase
VHPVAADYQQVDALRGRLDALPLPPRTRRVACFLGSTIGNLHPPDAARFLAGVRRLVGPAGALLIGADLRKDPAVLHAAYNDPAGVTAAFNRNLLVRLNRELDATFDPASFAHYAFYSPAAGRVEMHLVSLRAQSVIVAGEPIAFERGESIWTESSYKYAPGELAALAGEAGFAVAHWWTDDAARFAVAWLTPVGGARDDG